MANKKENLLSACSYSMLDLSPPLWDFNGCHSIAAQCTQQVPPTAPQQTLLQAGPVILILVTLFELTHT